MTKRDAQCVLDVVVIVHALQITPMHRIGLEIGYCGLLDTGNRNIGGGDRCEKVLRRRGKVLRVISSF